MSAHEQVLTAVRQRLQRERRVALARQAAWGSAAVALLAVVVHLWVRPLATSWMLAVVALPWLLAALQAMASRPSLAACSEWADRHLGGQSGFVTLQELSARSDTSSPAAIAHLSAWLDGVARSRLARLQELPLATRLARPLAAAIVCVSLAVALLQIPTQPLAAPRVASPVASVTAPDGPESTARPDSPSRDDASASSTPGEENAPLGDERASRNGSPAAAQPSQQQAASGDDSAIQVHVSPPDAAAAARASSTGREAGDSVDAGDDAALTAPWQGELAARLREIASTQTPPAGRADPAETTEYAAATATADVLPDGVAPEAAAAVPPPAAPSLTLGPAEQAYVRAYSADTGAKR